MKEETDYPSTEEYYPKKFPCRNCGKPTHGILTGEYNPLKICNDCAIPTKTMWDGEESYFRDADGSVSLA